LLVILTFFLFCCSKYSLFLGQALYRVEI